MDALEYIKQLTDPMKLRVQNQELLNSNFLGRIMALEEKIEFLIQQLNKGKENGTTNNEDET